MKFKLPELLYNSNALEPIISEETITYHYKKHHQTYINNLNILIEKNTNYINKNLEEIIKNSSDAIFNNAAQVFNHNFYWNCLSPNKSKISYKLEELIIKSYQSIENFKQIFSKISIESFGSAWIWLVKNNNNLEIISKNNAGCPLTDNKKPLLVFDVWEHAYYIDYRNARNKYIEAIWEIINWDFVSNQLIN